MRHIGYNNEISKSDNSFLMSEANIEYISNTISNMLQGVHPENKIIKVPSTTIESIIHSVYNNFKPTTGDIHSRYHIDPEDCKFNTFLDKINHETIGIIVTEIKSNFATDEKNSKLSVWNTILGDFNSHKIRSHSSLKVNNNSLPVQFHMRY